MMPTVAARKERRGAVKALRVDSGAPIQQHRRATHVALSAAHQQRPLPPHVRRVNLSSCHQQQRHALEVAVLAGGGKGRRAERVGVGEARPCLEHLQRTVRVALAARNVQCTASKRRLIALVRIHTDSYTRGCVRAWHGLTRRPCCCAGAGQRRGSAAAR
eukprot:971521-Prymnesium_polylepis.2